MASGLRIPDIPEVVNNNTARPRHGIVNSLRGYLVLPRHAPYISLTAGVRMASSWKILIPMCLPWVQRIA